MITTKLYLDSRRTSSGNGVTCPLKLCLVKSGKAALVSLGIKVEPGMWDKEAQRVKGCPNERAVNLRLMTMRVAAENLLFRLEESGETAGMDVVEVKRLVELEIDPDKRAKAEQEAARAAKEGKKGAFAERFLQFAGMKRGGTREIYLHTFRRMEKFMEDVREDGGEARGLRSLDFEDVTRDWLTRFDAWLEENGSRSKNARNIHLRNIRAVFNAALDDEVTAAYPFRRFKIRPEATAKRSLPVERLRELWSWPVEEVRREYLDVFKLVFLLIGINMVDLCGLTEVRDGRVEYRRAKTGRLYSIKVEPEAMELIGKHRGEGHLLDILDRWKSHKDYLHRLNENLRKVGRVTVGKRGKKDFEPLCPGLTTYWARHSWATIAASLDIPKETIAHALGHGGNTVTDIYIDFDRRKVDEANRRVIDWVLYGKR